MIKEKIHNLFIRPVKMIFYLPRIIKEFLWGDRFLSKIAGAIALFYATLGVFQLTTLLYLVWIFNMNRFFYPSDCSFISRIKATFADSRIFCGDDLKYHYEGTVK